MKQTDVFIVADLSGSMLGAKEQKLREMTKELIATLAAAESKGDQVFNVTLVAFSNTVSFGTPIVASALKDGHIQALSCRAPGMGGGTSLCDAIGLSFEASKPGNVTLISVFSDGMENTSYLYSQSRLRAKLTELEQTGNMTLTFAGPAQAKVLLANIGIPAQNFRMWDGSEQEMAAVAADTKQAITEYATSRSAGVTRSTRFYADTDKLTDSGVKGFTKLVVPSEVRLVTKRMEGRAIADFYGASFKPGQHYYELIKPEYLQDDKDIVIYMEDKNEYRQGSRAVRILLGLPETGRVRVHPGKTTGKYKIFVQSSSSNRKMVEGQTMITLAS